MAEPELKVVVLGDSAMWGQGLLDKDKFALKSVQEISKLLGREMRIAINTARSGAPIRVDDRGKSAKDKRKAFVDTYPAMFNSPKLRDNFIEENIQEVPLLLHGENPAPFPTISYQVQRVPENVARDAELVIMDGAANDLDFEEFLHPEEHRNNFVKHYDPLLKEYSYTRVKSLLRQAREKFPKAVIIYTGYFSPFAYGVSHNEMKDLFEHLSGEAEWLIWLNNSIVEIKDTDQLVREAQIRSEFGAARGLYWIRKAIAEANMDPEFRGPGILFVHRQFGPENTVFAKNSFFHREYEVSKVKDKARKFREANCPRIEHFDDMQSLLIGLQQFLSVTKEVVQNLRSKLDGPAPLLAVLDRLAENPLDVNDRSAAMTALIGDLKRITHVQIASFVHPNEKGAQRYTAVIVKRFTERHHRIQLRDDLKKLQKAGSKTPVGLKKSLKRYGLEAFTHLRAISPLMLVDLLALELVTAEDSAAGMFDDIFLNLGGKNRWQLNFPYRFLVAGGRAVALKFHAHFEPGTSDLFTIDARGVHLGSITQFTLERSAHPSVENLADLLPKDFSEGMWKPSKVTLFVNGIEVFSVPFFSNLTRGNKLTFPYPAK